MVSLLGIYRGTIEALLFVQPPYFLPLKGSISLGSYGFPFGNLWGLRLP